MSGDGTIQPAQHRYPTVEVVVFSFNHQDFIERALTSILNQKLDFPIQIRVHDDASTDSTPHIVREIAKHSSIPIELFVAPENRYQNGSRFKFDFIKASRSDFIAVLDADDFWIDEDKLALQVHQLLENPSISISHHPHEVWQEDKKIETVGQGAPEIRPGNDLSESNFIGTSSVVLRRESLPESLPYGYDTLIVDDWPIWALTSQDSFIGHIDRPMSVYRIHDKNFFANQDLAQKDLQVLQAMVFITNSISPHHQQIWLEALKRRASRKPSLIGRVVSLKKRLVRPSVPS